MLYSKGLITGLVVDIGESHSSVTPIFEGLTISHAQQYSPVGCLQVSDLLVQLMRPKLLLSGSIDRFITAKRILESKAGYILPDGKVIGSVEAEQAGCVKALFDK